MSKTRGLIGCIAECRDCGIRWEDYKSASRLASHHARQTGHNVIIETTYAIVYNELVESKP